MAKKYFVDIFWFKCPICMRSNHQKIYCRVYDPAQIREAHKRGTLKYTCHHCHSVTESGSVLSGGESFPVSEQEALTKGLRLDVQ
jgi:hypothetical protein